MKDPIRLGLGLCLLSIGIAAAAHGQFAGSDDSIDGSPADNPGFDNFTATYLNTPATPPVLGAPVLQGTSAVIHFQSVQETSYTLESKDNLATPDWQTGQFVLGNGSTRAIRDQGPLPRHRYYRLRIP